MSIADEFSQSTSPEQDVFLMSENADGTIFTGRTSFLEASPAKTLALLERASALAESAVASGLNTSESLASYDLTSQLWRTSQLCLTGDFHEFSEGWPRSGTMRNGTVYPRRPLVPLTSVTGSSWLPTLGKNEFKGSSKVRYRNSPHFRGAKMSEGLRTCESDPIYLHPSFAEVVMGYPLGWTELADAGTQSCRKSLSGSAEES